MIGKSGLEEQYDSYLRGQNGFQEIEVDASGQPVPHANLITVSPTQGDKLVLTIDNNLQKAMENGMDRYPGPAAEPGIQCPGRRRRGSGREDRRRAGDDQPPQL